MSNENENDEKQEYLDFNGEPFSMGKFIVYIEQEIRSLHDRGTLTNEREIIYGAVSALEALGMPPERCIPKRWGLALYDGPTIAESTPIDI